MTGGAGADVYQLETGAGHDVIADFWAGTGMTDRLQFLGGQFAGFSAMLANAAETGSSVVITIDASNSVTLEGVSISQLVADDFLFG